MWEINKALAGVWEITISSEKESHTGAVGSQGAQSKHRKMITAIILFRRRKCHYYGRTVIFEFLDCNRAGGQEAEEEEKEEKLGKAEDAHGPALDWAVEVGILVTASFTRCCFCFFLLLTSICSIGEKKKHTLKDFWPWWLKYNCLSNTTALLSPGIISSQVFAQTDSTQEHITPGVLGWELLWKILWIQPETSDVTKTSTFHHQEVLLFWVSVEHTLKNTT